MVPIHQKIKARLALALAAGSIFLSAFIAFAPDVRAATLSFSSGTGYAVGQTFAVDISVSTAPNESINAVSASVTFSPDQLQLVSISQTKSIVSVWASAPTFSNIAGSADLEGVIFNPGFTGTNGTVATLNFRVRSAGLATLGFGQASVLANDGKGTNVLTDAPAKSIYLGSGASGSATTDAGITPGAPSAPVIVSATNPDPSKWYATSSPSFSWSVPSDVTALRLQYDQSQIATPSVVYSASVTNKTLSKVPDGVYYLHAQFKNAKGWGAIAHFKFSIDTVPPVPFKITEAHPGDTTEARPILYFNTTDGLSGMDHYSVKVGDRSFMTVSADTVPSNPYTPPTQDPGEKTVVVIAYDKAGNETTASAQIDIQALNAPIIGDFPSSMTEGDLLRITGTSYPRSTVTITLKDPNGTETSEDTKTMESGSWTLIWSKHLFPGLYTFTAKTVDEKGGQSNDSLPVTLNVNPQVIYQIGAIAVNYFSIGIFTIAILALLIGAVIYAYHRLKSLRHRIRLGVGDAEHSVHERFQDLRDEIANSLSILEAAQLNRKLTKEEEKLIGSFRKFLASAEREIADKLDVVKHNAEE